MRLEAILIKFSYFNKIYFKSKILYKPWPNIYTKTMSYVAIILISNPSTLSTIDTVSFNVKIWTLVKILSRSSHNWTFNEKL